jgi:hypothetical protein
MYIEHILNKHPIIGAIKELDDLFEDEEDIGEIVAQSVIQSEVDEEKVAESQSIERSKQAIRETLYGSSYRS